MCLRIILELSPVSKVFIGTTELIPVIGKTQIILALTL
jgi:hypothetical protein